MATCRVCGAATPERKILCDQHRNESRTASRKDTYLRKTALRELFAARGLKFEIWRPLTYLYRQLGYSAPKTVRKDKPPPALPINRPRRRITNCANPVCGREFMQSRRDQRYCRGRKPDCQQQAGRIRRLWIPRMVSRGLRHKDAMGNPDPIFYTPADCIAAFRSRFLDDPEREWGQ